jgi:hypothetical protein
VLQQQIYPIRVPAATPSALGQRNTHVMSWSKRVLTAGAIWEKIREDTGSGVRQRNRRIIVAAAKRLSPETITA